MRRACLLLVLALAPLLGTEATAQTPPDARAEALNEEGKALYLDRKDYPAAVAKFRAALAIRRDPRYTYNLCAALERLGQLESALEACEDAKRQDPRPELADKAQRRVEDIRRAMARRQSAEPKPYPPYPNPPPNPNPPPSSEPGAGAPSEPPASDPYDASGAGHRWSLGVDAGLVTNGSLGYTDLFARIGPALRLHADFLVAPRLPLFLEPYLDLESFGRSDSSSVSLSLAIIDLGIAVTWQRRLFGDVAFTPAAGLSLSVLAVGRQGTDDSYLTGSLRADVAFEWAPGGGHHVLSLVPLGLAVYGGASTQLSGTTTPARTYGLDTPGVAISVLIGYRYRFQTLAILY